MSSSRDLVVALKAELRRAGITYAELAQALNLAESSVKRMFSRGDMPLSRIDAVLAVLKMDFAELAHQVALAQPPRPQLTLAQEQAVVADPKLLLVAICALSQWTLAQIVAHYQLTQAQALASLLALDRLGILELRPNNQYRLRISKTVRWRPDGPVMRFFRDHVVDDYFAGGFDGDGETLMLVHGRIGATQAAQFSERLQRLGQDLAEQQRVALQQPPADLQAFTLVVGLRAWLFAPFRQWLREPPAPG